MPVEKGGGAVPLVEEPVTEDPVIAGLPEILSFAPGTALLDVRRRFMLLASDALGVRLAVAAEADAVAGQALAERIGDLPGDALLRLLLAPETIHRLLWSELHEPDEVTRFLRRGVEAEHARCGNDHELEGPTWTALGDVLAGGSDDVPTLAMQDFPPIVLGDPELRHPTARDVEPGDAGDGLIPADALPGVISALREAQLRIRTAGDEMWAFARELNTTLVLRTGGSAKASFASSSPERYVGRSNLWNAHDPEVTPADLAEAMVHEAIHTVLDAADALHTRVQPRTTRWVTDPALYDGVSRTVSAWTGRDLDVPTYVHAYFVWYGLLCFWTKALLGDAVDSSTAKARVIRAGGPFMTRSALEPLRPFFDAIRPDVATLLERIQDQVADEFEGLPAATSVS